LIATISTALPSPLKAFQGSISNSDDAMPGSFGGPVGPNTAYAAGSFLGQTLVDYFGFNLSKVTATVSSAKLILYSGAITNDLTYTLFGATQLVSQFTSSADQNAALYTSLVKSVTMINTYGSYQLGFVGDITFALNAAAVEDINAAIAARETFVVAGAVGAPVPEPSTWLMMLAGFAGLGVVARRRAVKRRAAATAG
jgi:hypothetical protein